MKKLLIISSLLIGASALGDVSDRYFRPESLKKDILIERNVAAIGTENKTSLFLEVMGLLLFTGIGGIVIFRSTKN